MAEERHHQDSVLETLGMRISFVMDNLQSLKANCIEKKLPLVMGDEVAE